LSSKWGGQTSKAWFHPSKWNQGPKRTHLHWIDFQSLYDNEKQAIFDERKRLRTGSTSKSTPRRVAVLAIPKWAKVAPLKSVKKSIQDEEGNFFYEGHRLKNVREGQQNIQQRRDSNVQDNAGNQFGGRKKKKGKKAGQQD
jgi:hypothetical protein